MKAFKSEFIAIGTELLLGQVMDTNAKWMSEQFALNGINTYYHTVVGDNFERVKATFKQAQSRSNLIIVSGGLGPTDDDMTREAFQAISKINIIEHEPSMNKIKSFFKKQQTDMTPNNRRQARVFEQAIIVDNKIGMAPGMIIEFEGRTWVFLPGVPRELKQMFTDSVLPYVKKESGEEMVIESMIIRFIGIGESLLEHKLQAMIRSQTNPTIAPLALTDGLVIRLTAKERSTEQAHTLLNETKDKILAEVGEFVCGINNETIIDRIFAMLKKQNKRVSAAESLTGGMFTEKLISLDGASAYCPGAIVCYDTAVKINVLNVSPTTIDRHGVVSKACASEMARNSCDLFDSDIGISFTGVAGPGQLEGHAVGTVFIALYTKTGDTIVEKFHFQGDREKIRNRATRKGYEILFNYLKSVK